MSEKLTKRHRREISQNQNQQMMTVQRASLHSGPLPSPETLAGYEHTLPGAAERIVKMAELQAEHRRELEKTQAQTSSKATLRGQVFGFVLLFTLFLFAFALLMFGKQLEGFATLIGAGGAAIIQVLYRKWTLKKPSA